MYFFVNDQITILVAISCFLSLVQVRIGATPQDGSSIIESLSKPKLYENKILNLEKPNHLKELESHYLQPPVLNVHDDSTKLERRSGGGGGGGTQVAISLERVKNPDDEDSYGYKKKKKFPIVWLRNQYPFTKYYKKKYKQPSKYPADLNGQYSSQSYDVFDPNPSTWVKIPDRPTASIKFQKQASPSYNFQNHVPPPASLIPPNHPFLLTGRDALSPVGAYSAAIPQQPMPYKPNFGKHPSSQMASGLLTAESQQYDQPSQFSVPSPSGGAAATVGGAKGGESGNYGGISLSFGNGRSISFGGGQGLTIGGRAGAISIGGSKGSGDNQEAASGSYSSSASSSNAARPAYGSAVAASNSGSSAAGYQTTNGAGYGTGDSYVNKHPTMSMDFPRRGKKLVHANLDMAPIKFRLHSSPRVKITTGSRDPLEKPSEEEQEEEEEDIFEPPVPFEKKNSTADADAATNGTTTTDLSSMNGTSSSGNGTAEGVTTISPMLLTNDYEYSSKGYQQQQHFAGYQQHFGQFQEQQVPIDDYRPAEQPVQQQQLYPQRQSTPPVGLARDVGKYRGPTIYELNGQHQHQHPPNNLGGNQYTGTPFNPLGPVYQVIPPQHSSLSPHPSLHYQPFQEAQFRQQPNSRSYFPQPGQANRYQIDPATSPKTTFQMQPASPTAPLNQQQLNTQMQPPVQPGQPPIEEPAKLTMPQPMLDQMQPESKRQTEMDNRPAVNQWRQFSQDARQQVARNVPTHHEQPNIDHNPRFYNGGAQIHPNSIVEQPQGMQGAEGRELVEMSASNQRNYVHAVAPAQVRPQGQPAGGIQHPQFGPATAYQMAQQSDPSMRPAQVYPAHHNSRLPAPRQQPQYQPHPGKQVQRQQQQQQPQALESNYRPPSYSGRSKNVDDGTRTYTFGNGGLSSYYGSSAGGNEHDQASGSSSGSQVSDGFDQKNYQAKVEKFDPEAHDKRERSKVVLFLRPRISIHQANSSTTTKRPKNQQRFINVINRPIFLNTTNATHHEDEDFIDPDLKEPMDLGYGGYGGYGSYGAYGRQYGYGQKPSTSTTTKKPKPKRTTTTTTTTTSSPESTTTEATTTNSPETTTTSSPSTSSESSSTTDSSSTTSTTTECPGTCLSSSTTETPTSTEGTTSTTTSTSTSTSTEYPSSSSSTTTTDSSTYDGDSRTSSEYPSSTGDDSYSPDSSTSSSSDDLEASSSPTSTTTESPTTTPSVTSVETERDEEATTTQATPTSSTESSPEVETFNASPESSTNEFLDSDPADLVAAATTESSSSQIASVSTASLPRTTRASSLLSMRLMTSTSSTTMRPALETSSPTSLPSKPEETSTRSGEHLASGANSAQSSSPAPSSSSPPMSSDDSDTVVEQQNPSKRSPISKPQNQQQQQQPMLLSPELIDKLMSNRTLVNLMSSQLKRVVDSVDRMDDREKRHIVRQVFEQMMEDKVDFSMNNVRLAVKTVSSSYKAAAEKQRSKHRVAEPKETTRQSKSVRKQVDIIPGEHFGRRAVQPVNSPSFAEGNAKGVQVKRGEQTARADNRLQLQQPNKSTQSLALSIKSSRTSSSTVPSTSISSTATSTLAQRRNSSNNNGSSQGGGDPIVVVLVPQEKA